MVSGAFVFESEINHQIGERKGDGTIGVTVAWIAVCNRRPRPVQVRSSESVAIGVALASATPTDSVRFNCL